MEKSKRCGIGLAGAGIVGGGVADLLLGRKELLKQRTGVDIDLAWVADMDMERAIQLGVTRDRVVDDFHKLMDKSDIDVIIELIGGTGVAYDCVMAALDAGKHVVTANKALLAERGPAIFAKAKEKNRIVAFEAAVAGGIPLLLSLREGLVVNRMQSLLGIVNGTCNYILSEMAAKGLTFDACLKEAQRLGFAEANPSSDIDGKDSGHKLALLSALSFDTWIDFTSLHIEGIRNIQDTDIKITRELGYTLKLLGVIRPDPRPEMAENGGKGDVTDSGRVFLSVHPGLLKNSNPLAAVSGSMNGVITNGDAVMESMFYGRGAGRYPTASAVVSDIAEVAKTAVFGGIGPRWFPPAKNAYTLAPMEDYQARYYLRFSVADRPGVVGKITTALGANNVSIVAVHQFEYDVKDGHATVCLFTHMAREGDVRLSLAAIEKLNLLEDAPTLLRIEE